MSPAIAIGSLEAHPGNRVTGVVPVDVGVATLEVPVAIVHGSRPGPRVSVTAGIHGAEYVSMAALRQVVLALDPDTVTGSLVAVLTASPAAFVARSIYVNPLDGLNLNRQFPGDRHGSPTQRLAHWLTTTVIALSAGRAEPGHDHDGSGRVGDPGRPRRGRRPRSLA